MKKRGRLYMYMQKRYTLAKNTKKRGLPPSEKKRTLKPKAYEPAPAEKNSNINIFLESVQVLAPDDISVNSAVLNAKKREPDYLRYLFMLLFLGIFIYTGYSIAERIVGYIKSDISNARIRDMFYGNDIATDIQSMEMPEDIEPMADLLSQQFQVNVRISAEVADRSELKKIQSAAKNMRRMRETNPDMRFYLNVPGTNINYPVVQTTDNDYYLYYNFEKKKDPSGAIFLDYRNSGDLENSYNTVIYGHNMRSNTMFRALCYFGDYKQKFMDGKIEIYTEDATYIFQIFAAYVCRPDYGYIRQNFDTGEEFVDFCTKIEERSIFRRPDFTITEDDRIITLSTCAISTLDLRFAVHGKLVEIIKE